MLTTYVEFSCCVPCSGEQSQALTIYIYIHIALFVIMLPNIDALLQHILVLNGTKHQLSVYDKMPMLYIL
jgi:hypothetical protein